MLLSTPTLHVNAFFTRITPLKFVEKEIMTDKVIQCVLKMTTPTECKKYMVLTITLSLLIFCTKLSGMDPNEKGIYVGTIGGHA